MGLFNWFKNKKNNELPKQAEITDLEFTNRHNLIEITRILTENDEEALGIIRQLVEEPEEFASTHPQWLAELNFSVTEQADIITAYWLTGYETSQVFGSYHDWKDSAEEVLWSLPASLEAKGYPVELKAIGFAGEELMDEVIEKVSLFLADKGFKIVTWDLQSDCYHLFVIQSEDFAELIRLGDESNIKFS